MVVKDVRDALEKGCSELLVLEQVFNEGSVDLVGFVRLLRVGRLRNGLLGFERLLDVVVSWRC